MNDFLHEMVLLIAMLLALSVWSAWEEEQQLGCITDTECMAMCPINEPDCDGGEQ